MNFWILIFIVLFCWNSDSYAQMYKIVNPDGSISFTDTPPPSPSSRKPLVERNPAPGIRTTPRSEVKDILQMAREMLDQELAKPPKKQNQKLIRELNDVLYGDVSGKTNSAPK